MRTIKTYRKVGAFYIAWEADFSTSIRSVVIGIDTSFTDTPSGFIKPGCLPICITTTESAHTGCWQRFLLPLSIRRCRNSSTVLQWLTEVVF